MINLVNWQQEEPTGCGGGRQLSMDGTSRVTGDSHARFCERLGVRFPGPTRRQWATAVPTATQSHAPSKHHKPGGSSRSRRWVGSIIDTNVAPPEPRRVEPQQQTTLLPTHRRLSLRRGPADRGDVDKQQPLLHCVRITAFLSTLSVCVCWIGKPSCGPSILRSSLRERQS